MPKGIDIWGYSLRQLNAIARQLDERQRKSLGFHTPAEMFVSTRQTHLDADRWYTSVR